VAPRSLAFYFRSSSIHGNFAYFDFTGFILHRSGLMFETEMKSSTVTIIARNNNLTIDVIGVILALGLGLGGQIFILNPINILSPKLPMLSQQDWPHSHTDQGVRISEIGNDQQDASSPFYFKSLGNTAMTVSQHLTNHETISGHKAG
jgi:hypothetical protein